MSQGAADVAGITECACCIGSPKIEVAPGPDSCSACVDGPDDDGCPASWSLYVAIALCLMAFAIAIIKRKTLAANRCFGLWSRCSRDESIDEEQPAKSVENPTAAQ